MKKLRRFIFSGAILIFLALLLEILVFIFGQFFLDDILINIGVIQGDIGKLWYSIFYGFAKLIAFVVGLIIFFIIINKNEDPEFKIPWIVFMLLLPFFASVMYLIFGNHGLRKKDKRIVEGTNSSFKDYFKKEKDEIIQLENDLGNSIGAFKYINSTTSLGVHKNNRVKYYKTGEEFFPDFIKNLKEAKEFIFMEFFIISDGKLWDEIKDILIEKSKSGVDVRLIYDDMGCSGTISSFTPKRLAAFGIKCYKFHPFRPIISGVFNNRDHRKIAIIDHKYAFTGGINLADEYANLITRFGYWKDTMVRIEGSAIENLIITFFQNYNLATGTVNDLTQFLNYKYEKFPDEGFVMPFGDGPGSFDNHLIGEQNYINILNYAKKKVFISTPYLIPTYSLTDAMRNAALRGVEVNLIVPGIPDKKMVYEVAKYNFSYLLEAGVKVWIYKPGFNHMKAALADDELAFVGTINFDFRSLVHHFECGTLLYKNPCLKDLKEDFTEMLKVSGKVKKDYKLKGGKKIFCSLIKIITPLL